MPLAGSGRHTGYTPFSHADHFPKYPLDARIKLCHQYSMSKDSKFSVCKFLSAFRASNKIKKKSFSDDCPLVMIEWEDSAQPIPNWSYLESFEASGTIRCVSVGWLIHDDGQMMALAPNMGAIDDEKSLQVSGVIQIPARCVLHVTKMQETS